MKKETAVHSMKEEDRWQTEDDLRTLTRAEEIRKDAKRMARVKRLAKERLAEINGLIEAT